MKVYPQDGQQTGSTGSPAGKERTDQRRACSAVAHKGEARSGNCSS